MPIKVWLSWSSGKDSAYALSVLLKNPKYEVTGLFTTITDDYKRVSMHSVREVLLDAQAKNVGIPLHKIRIPAPCPNKIYEKKMRTLVKKAKAQGVEAMAFGDLFLEDIRDYRVKNLEGTGIKPLFPVWGQDTKQLARDIINAGFRAVITCVDEKKLGPEFSGKKFDEDFLEALPEGVDPCGEYGEFHSFVYAAPFFQEEIKISIGEKVSREGFTFTDVLPE